MCVCVCVCVCVCGAGGSLSTYIYSYKNFIHTLFVFCFTVVNFSVNLNAVKHFTYTFKQTGDWGLRGRGCSETGRQIDADSQTSGRS